MGGAGARAGAGGSGAVSGAAAGGPSAGFGRWAHAAASASRRTAAVRFIESSGTRGARSAGAGARVRSELRPRYSRMNLRGFSGIPLTRTS